MHDNELKLVRDISGVVGSELYQVAKEVFTTAGFSNQFIVRSLTKDGSITFGCNNMLHWNVIKGWVLNEKTSTPDFQSKISEALLSKLK